MIMMTPTKNETVLETTHSTKYAEFIQNQSAQYLQSLIDFIQIPSISTENQGIDEAVQWLTQTMRKNHLTDIKVHKTPPTSHSYGALETAP